MLNFGLDTYPLGRNMNTTLLNFSIRALFKLTELCFPAFGLSLNWCDRCMKEDRLARPLKFTNTFCVRAYLVLIELIDSDNHLGDLAIGAIVNSTKSLGLFLSISKHRAYSHLESTIKPVAVYILGRSVICSNPAQALLLISRYVQSSCSGL